MSSVKEALTSGVETLTNFSDTPSLDVSILFEFVTGITRVKQISDPGLTVSDIELNKFKELLTRRKLQEPIAYIIQSKGFWKYDFYVDKRVLIPRPETELLVETGLGFVQGLLEDSSRKKISILDLGCGSGCIGLSILKDLQDREMGEEVRFELTLVDKSEAALEVAKLNAQSLNLESQSKSNFEIKFLKSDWMDNVEGIFDLIVSNPPYIDKEDPRVYSGAIYEPDTALFAKDNGHSDIEIILKTAPNRLQTPGLLLIEIGQGSSQFFAERVSSILVDSNGIARVLRVDSVCAHR